MNVVMGVSIILWVPWHPQCTLGNRKCSLGIHKSSPANPNDFEHLATHNIFEHGYVRIMRSTLKLQGLFCMAWQQNTSSASKEKEVVGRKFLHQGQVSSQRLCMVDEGTTELSSYG